MELLDRRIVEQATATARSSILTDGHWTYRQLLETANRIAHVLVEDLGVVPGNRVLLRGAQQPDDGGLLVRRAQGGRRGGRTMPLLRVRELTYIVEKAKIRLALSDARVAADCEAAMPNVVHFQGDHPYSLETRMAGKPATFDNCDTAADDTALIAFTSGTTGQGKGTMHFHRDVIAACDCFPPTSCKPEPGRHLLRLAPARLHLRPRRHPPLPAADRRLDAAAGAGLAAAAPARGSRTIRATIVFTAPTAYRAMTELVQEKAFDISSLRKCVSAGETLPKATFEKWREATGLEIIDGIGSTEMLHIFISSSGADIRPGATGKVVPGYEARVVDDAGNEVPPGTIGHLAVRGPTGCRYLDNLERQRVYVQNGWNHPGDSYVMDADGYFWYQARTDDMIVSAGHNISGPEVEAVLLDHPAVAECGVVGAPDEIRGRIVKAYVVLRPGFPAGPERVKELQDFVKAEIAPYKYPRAIEFVENLPRTETGKLQRFRLRERDRERDQEREP